MIALRCLYCVTIFILVISTLTNAFVPKPRPLALPKVDQKFNPPTTGLLPPTAIVVSAFEIYAKLDAANVIVDSNVVAESKESNKLAWRAVVLGICVVWATNFAVIKEIFQAAPTIDPSLYAAIRFSLAGIVMLPRALNSVKNVELIVSSMTVGLSVFFGYFGQAIGLMTTTANKSSFICSLNVVCVALLSSIIKKELKIQTWISSFLAVAGVAVLEADGSSPPVIGDVWSLCQPVGFGVGYVFLEYIVAKFPDNPGAITAYKILSIAIASIIWAATSGHSIADLQPIMESNIAVGGLLYTGLVTTAGALWLQSYAFEEVPATDVSLILSLEPIFATLFAASLIGEGITANDVVGGAIILFACLSNEFNLYEKVTGKKA